MLSAHKESGRASQGIYLNGALENEKKKRTSETESKPGAEARRPWRKCISSAFQ